MGWKRFMLKLQLLSWWESIHSFPSRVGSSPFRSLLNHQPQIVWSGCALSSMVLLRYRPCPTHCGFLWCWSSPTSFSSLAFLEDFAKIY